jgi:hypothetical protein
MSAPVVFREKDTFTNNLIKTVQQAVDRLETEIGHPNMIPVGIGSRYFDSSLPSFPYGTDLFVETVFAGYMKFCWHG